MNDAECPLPLSASVGSTLGSRILLSILFSKNRSCSLARTFKVATTKNFTFQFQALKFLFSTETPKAYFREKNPALPHSRTFETKLIFHSGNKLKKIHYSYFVRFFFFKDIPHLRAGISDCMFQTT